MSDSNKKIYLFFIETAMDFRTIQNAFDKLRTQQGRLAVLQRHIEMLQNTVRKFNSMFVGNKIKDEYLTIEQHERKYE